MFCKLEHQLLDFYKNQNFPELSSVCVAVSGGLDSMAMLALHQRLSKILKIKLIVIHIHHGLGLNSTDSSQNSFRDKAYQLVKNYCNCHKLEFFSNIDKKNKNLNIRIKKKVDAQFSEKEGSEAFYRKYRYECFDKVFLELDSSFKILVTAHTANDLLETRLMRLMRGVGAQGLPSMKPVRDTGTYHLVRPLLKVMHSDLELYLKSKETPFVEDPSNQDLNFFRNWLRQQILPLIHKKDSKYLGTMAKSLNIVSSALEKSLSSVAGAVIIDNQINLSLFYSLSTTEKKQILAQYLYDNKVQNYSMGHILEVLKYLAKPEKEQSFKLAKKEWLLSQGLLYILDNSLKNTNIKTD